MSDQALATTNQNKNLTVSDSAQERELNGAERSALLLLSLGETYAAPIFERLDDMEIKQVSVAMSKLGPVTPDMLENLLIEFVTHISSGGGVSGNFDSTERLLMSFLPAERVQAIMEEIRGPAGRTIWEKLSNVQETVLANYLKNEYPQTVAVVLSKIKSDHAGRVLSILPEDFSLEVVHRMLKIEAVQKDIVAKVEDTLRTEFMSTLSMTTRRDSHEMMADIFNSFDRQTEARFLASLEESAAESAERIKGLMFTFDDLGKLDAGSVQTLLREVEKDVLAIALKGSNETMRDFFFKNMSSRAAQLMEEDMEAMGPIRLKDVDEAQGTMVNVAKDLAAKGDIVIAKGQGDDEMIY